MMLAIMAAAALALPAAGADFTREVEREMPARVLRTNVAGIWYQAFVDANGKITQCTVRGTLGESDAANLACKSVIGRQITPARVDGKPAYGVYRGVMELAGSSFDAEEIVFEPDVMIEVASLPSNGPVRTELVVMIDTEGRVSACEGKDGSNSSYVRTACSQAKEMRMAVGKSEAGEAVAYVYPVTFEFTENLASR